jgi:hypothetical protein
MNRAAQETEAGLKVEILALEAYAEGAVPLEPLLENLGRLLDEGAVDHIYCELPWSFLDEALLLEDWIASREEFREPNASWGLGFVGLCPADAQRLPALVREGLEEFSRASKSAIIVPRVKGEEGPPPWWGTEELDFGRLVEVFEEEIWPIESEDVRRPPERSAADEALEDLTVYSIPVQGTRETYLEICRDLCGGRYGRIWGAEVAWTNEDGVFEAFTLSQGRLYGWKTEEPSLARGAPLNGALFHVAGQVERSDELLAALRSQTFC